MQTVDMPVLVLLPITINPVLAPAIIQIEQMKTSDWVAISISILSLILSIAAAYLSWRSNEVSLRRSSRQDHAAFLVEKSRTLIENPELFAIYDSHQLSKEKSLKPLDQAKREAFLHLHFNMFELVHDFYENIVRKGKVDKIYWETWEKYIDQFIRESSEARMVFKSPRTQEVYSPKFVEYMGEKIDRIEK